MTDDQFQEIGKAISLGSDNAAFVLVLHDEQTGEMRLSSNLSAKSLRKMLKMALDKAELLDLDAVIPVHSASH